MRQRYIQVLDSSRKGCEGILYESEHMQSPSDDDDDWTDRRQQRRRFVEFDCPECHANNPTDAFGHGDDVLCHYCGATFWVKVNDEGKLVLKER